MKNLINKMFRDPISAGATLGIGLGKAVGDNVMDLAFARPRQKIQLEGQKKALEQQNAAQLDMWNKTNYEAQMKHLNAAGLNPGLLYGMSGGGATTTGSASAMPDQTTKSYGIDTMGAAQLALLKAQKDNIEADTANKLNKNPVGQTQADKNIAEAENTRQNTKNQATQQIGLDLDNKMKEINNNVADLSQWNTIGKIQQEFLKATQEYRSAAAKANIDTTTQETEIQIRKADLATNLLHQEAVRKGIQLTDAQMNKIHGEIMTMMKEAETGRMNAETNQKNASTGADRLQWDKTMNNVTEEMQLTIDVVKSVLQAVGIGKAIEGMKQTVPTKGYNKWGTQTAPKSRGGFDLK